METAECLKCQKPLGQESKDLGWVLCHTCRICPTCNRPISPKEAEWCIEKNYPPKHARCLTLEDGMKDLPIEQEVELMNMVRLLYLPDLTSSETANELQAEKATDGLILTMSLEEKFLFMRKMQSAAARVSLLIKKDAKAIKESMETRARQQMEEAEKQRLTSSRPASKPVDDEQEKALGSFMLMSGITDRKLAIKKFKDREKAIASFVNLGMSRTDAEATIDKQYKARVN